MPKRRLSYGEVVVGPSSLSPSAARRGPRRTGMTTPGASRPVSRKKSSDVLIKLSQSCNNHLSNCHKGRSVKVNVDDDEEKIPEQCRIDLEKLRNLLPEIEKKFHPNILGEKGPEAQDVAHLCDFYNSVMQGNYCPYAPHLFHLGKSPDDVLKRVIFLFRHIVSPVVIATIETCDVGKVEYLESVVGTITQTIARFLSFLGDISIFPKIIEDLVNLLHDCLFLSDTNILPVKVNLFSESLKATSATLDCSVEIDRLDQLWTLHMATTMVLGSFMIDQKQKKLQPHSATTLVASYHGKDDLPTGWVDLHFPISDRGLRNHLLATIASSIRSFLLLEGSLPISENLVSHGQLIGATMLKRLFSDWSILLHSPSVVSDYSLLVAEAIENLLVNSLPRPSEYVNVLRDLLQRVVMDPPSVAGQPSAANIGPTVGKLFLYKILNCVDAISRKHADNRDSLDAMVLMSIHFLLEDEDSNADVATLCLSNGFITPLLDLLHDLRFANHVPAILARLLLQMSSPHEINAQCHSCLKGQEDGTPANVDHVSNRTEDKLVASNSPMSHDQTLSRKRQKSADRLASPIRALTLAASIKRSSHGMQSSRGNTGRMSDNKPWTLAFFNTLDSSVHATQRIAQHCDGASTSETNSHSSENILTDAQLVVTTLRLNCRLVSRCADDGVDEDFFSFVLDVSRLLAEALLALCKRMANGEVNYPGIFGDAFPQIIVNCALDLHYSVGQLLSTHQHPFFKTITELIRTASFLSRRWLRHNDYCEAPSRHSFQGIDFPTATSVVERLSPQMTGSQAISSGAFSSFRKTLVSRLGTLYNNRDSTSFIASASLEILQAFPFGARCCWLVSLYPAVDILEDDLYIFGSYRSATTDSARESSVVTLVLLFLPMYLSSRLAVAPSETDALLKSLLKIIVEFVIPIARNLDQDDNILCRVVLYTVSWLDEFVSVPLKSPTSAFSPFDIFKAIQFLAGIFGQPDFRNYEQSSGPEVDVQIKECIHHLLTKIPENHADHGVRKLRWFCMAKSLNRCSTSDLRKYAYLQSTDFPADSPMKRAATSEFRSESCFMWLLESCFVDENHEFRQEACRALCRLLVGSNSSYLLAHFASEEDCQTLATLSRLRSLDETSPQVTYEVEHAAENVASEFFRAVDRLLHTSIGVCDSQLSFTMANSSSADSTTKGHGSQDDKIFMKRSALSFFSWFCSNANFRSPLGKLCFEKAFQRIVRIWAPTSFERDVDFSFSTSRALAFGELSRVCGQPTESQPIWGNDSPEFTAMLCSDVLVLSSSSSKKSQFFRLESFIRTTISMDLNEVLTNHRSLKACQSLVEEFMPSMVAQFVEERSLDLLRVAPAFRQFLNERLRKARKHSSTDLLVAGCSNAPDRWKYRSTTMSINDLDNEAKKMCLDNKILERVFPMLMMGMDRTALSFFTKDVLKGMTVSTLIRSREISILKGLIWELGQEPETSGSARNAIIATAAARSMEGAVPESDAELHRSLALGKEWVTNNFMYLLVSVVQFKWKDRSIRERLRAVRCLHGMLDFLAASEAPQYFPQIMATINSGISDACFDDRISFQERIDSTTLQLFAVKALSKIVRLVAEVQVETIALNLTTIVVALIPVVDDDSQGFQPRGDCTEAREAAVSILTFLTAGDLGRMLASHFNEIPFLPTSKSLGNVHQALLANGVDFDNLTVLSSTSQSQHGLTSTANAHDTTQASTIVGNSCLSENEKMMALQKRLTLICGMLENESTSVRMVSLGHLTDLLRGNRDTFSKLIMAEGSLAGKRFLTLTYKDDVGNAKWSSRGAAASMLEKLVSRCIVESETEVRIRLATCLGEVGAISETILGELKISGSTGDEAIDSPTSSFKWRLEQPPWQSQPVKYELQLVTRHLVVALKAAPSTTDQHKIAFAIQQLLHLLNSFSGENGQACSDAASKDSKGKMTKWLKENLEQSGQYDLVEPYFSSDFQEKSSDSYATKKPPLFKVSACYFTWMSSFCRWMIQGSKSADSSPKGWKDLFFACRTAIRTESGLIVAEFIVPLLVLDRICFGTSEERILLHREFAEIFQTTTKVFMDHSDRQKAVHMAFVIIDTLRIWSEREVEERSRGRSPTATSSRSRRQLADKYLVSPPTQCWPAEDSITRITELLKSIPLNVQAEAADVYGMNALALQRLEIEARDYNVLEIFEKTVDEQKKDSRGGKVSRCHTFTIPAANAYNIELLKKVLSRLDDCETMAAIGEDALHFDPMQQIRDNIRKQISLDNYESALEEFERAFQATNTNDRDGELIRGFLRCLMELGRYESVLNHVGGLEWNKNRYDKHETTQGTVSYAIEAAWKLGNWTKLSELLVDDDKGYTINSSQASQIAIGKAISAFRDRDMVGVESAIRLAREKVMQNLSNAAREGYEKSYDEIVTLQAIRELENAKEILILNIRDRNLDLIETAYSAAMDGWSWKGRVDVVTGRGALAIASPRIALARLDSNPMLEASLFLESGLRARKNHRFTMAETLLLQAQAALAPLRGHTATHNPKLVQLVYSLQVQQAKVKFLSGDCGLALKILGQRSVDHSVEEMLTKIDDMSVLEALATNCEKKLVLEWSGLAESFNEDGSCVVNRFSSRLLQLTRWSFEMGLKGTSEILDRFRLIQKLAPGWEKGHFYFGRFVDNVLQARMAAMFHGVSGRESLNGVDENEIRGEVIMRDPICQTHTLLAMRVYAAALKIDTKHVFQALPRLLSLWFDLVSVAREHTPSESGSKQDPLQMLRHHQNQANTFMATQVRDIPPIAFYTAMPQLIARVIHDDPETSMVVRSILQRVLVKFPQQAMWPLAWLQGSKIPDRAKIGEQIFQGAEKALAKNHKNMSTLVRVCKNLFEYLRNLAVYDQGSSERSNILNLRPWQHPEVDLSDFLPPIQAALAITPSTIDHATAKDHFTRTIPRMRAFSSRVGVMTSKAKPKKLRAYAVPGSYKAQRTGTAASAKSRSSDEIDIGELHFLVKQEAKGDLRKDARVQDLNNVINRLMSSNTGESGASSRRRRRLHLRTFAVTCLSEDIGILEWVPDTDSLRNLVSKSYNPQTSAACIRRRGSRLANFGDATLRSNYEMCQNKFFKEGNLAKAAIMFEDQCLRPFPPLLFWWFIQKFHSPHAWYEARNRFTLSAAAWSAVGHVIGLGDRHSENILVDTSSGECVHVDFDCIFDKGLNLPRPEVVPFRLTANMLDAFGPSGADGVYTAGLQTAMRTLRDNRDTLLSVLEPFLKDPVIDWKRHRGQQKAQSGTTMVVHTDKQAEEAKRSIKVIDERLQGIYNLRNPNLKKYRRRDQSTDQDDEFGHLVPLPVEGQVQRMIQEATSNENLVQLYVGWMPWV